MRCVAFAGAVLLSALLASVAAAEPNPCMTEGVFPEVAYHEGRLWCAIQQGESLEIVAMTGALEVAARGRLYLGPGALAFPRMGSAGGSLWLAYRPGGDTGKLARLAIEGGAVAARDTLALGPSWGNDPFAIGHGWLAYQSQAGAAIAVLKRPLAGGPAQPAGIEPRPTGLSRVLADGRVVRVDDDRVYAEAGRVIGTRPCWAADMVVVEGKDDGLIVRRAGAELLLWSGALTFTPRCAADGGRYAVATWGPRGHGARLRVLSASDFAAPVPPPGDGDGPAVSWSRPVSDTRLVARVGAGTVRLEGGASNAAGVEILVNLRKVGDATLSAGRWTYSWDASAYRGGLNLSARAVGSDGRWSRDTIRVEVRPPGHAGGPAGSPNAGGREPEEGGGRPAAGGSASASLHGSATPAPGFGLGGGRLRETGAGPSRGQAETSPSSADGPAPSRQGRGLGAAGFGAPGRGAGAPGRSSGAATALGGSRLACPQAPLPGEAAASYAGRLSTQAALRRLPSPLLEAYDAEASRLGLTRSPVPCLTPGEHLAHWFDARLPRLAQELGEPELAAPELAFRWEGLAALRRLGGRARAELWALAQ